MTRLLWDQSGERRFETGVEQGVLYIPNAGIYDNGVAWNGLTSVTESPEGGEPTPFYADNIKYASLTSLETFKATIEAYMYPVEFNQFDGAEMPSAGLILGQQTRKPFGLSYKTKIGSDQNENLGYRLHLVYGLTAMPSERQYATVNESPEIITFSWELSSTAVAATGYKPVSLITVDSTLVGSTNLTNLENALYGTAGTSPRLPLPDEVVALMAGSQTLVTPTAPTFVAGTGVITIPTVTGVTYRRADTNAVVTGTVTIGVSGQTLVIRAAPASGSYAFAPGADDDWSFTRS